MKKKLKSSRIKKIVVSSLNWSEEVSVDSDIFDDVYVEAATRAIEKHKRQPNFEVGAAINCCEFKNKKKPSGIHSCNSYFILINAGMHKEAEFLRESFFKIFQTDLKSWSLRSYDRTGPDNAEEISFNN